LRLNGGVSVYSPRLDPMVALADPLAGALHYVGQKMTRGVEHIGKGGKWVVEQVPPLDKLWRAGAGKVEAALKARAEAAEKRKSEPPTAEQKQKRPALAKRAKQAEEALRWTIDLVGKPGDWVGNGLEGLGRKLQEDGVGSAKQNQSDPMRKSHERRVE
jgi:hypothetical protein